MKRAFLTFAICAIGARALSAQAGPTMPGMAAKEAARKAAGATSEHIAAEQRTGEVVKSPAKPAEKMPVTPAGAPKKAVEAPAAAASAKKQANGLNVATPSDTSGPPAMIMREVYEYSRDGRRDPFISLLLTNELRPTMSDLKLTSLIYDKNGSHSLAVLRDLGTNTQYRVQVGSVLGRMHVAAIREHWIVFTIDEFGTNRQDSLVLGDTSKARLK
jgi:hypothetical protein